MQYNKLEDSDTGQDPRHIQSNEIINGGSVSVEGQGALLGAESAEARRKKYIKYGVIGGIVLIVVILAIVLPLTLINHEDPGDGHGPLPPGQMNPYSSISGSQHFSGSGSSFRGYLVADLNKQAQIKQLTT